LLSNNGTNVCQPKRVTVHEIPYNYKAILLTERANVNLQTKYNTYNEWVT